MFSEKQGEEQLHTLLCGELTGTEREGERRQVCHKHGNRSGAEGRCSRGQDELGVAVVRGNLGSSLRKGFWG